MDKKLLVELVRSSAKYVMDHAEELVGNTEGLKDFNIHLYFPIPLDKTPTIDVDKSYENIDSFRVVFEHFNGGQENG